MAGPDDEGVPAGEAVPGRAENIGQRVLQERGDGGLAVGGQAGCAQDVRGVPGAGRVDDGAGEQFLAVGEADQERGLDRRLIASTRVP